MSAATTPLTVASQEIALELHRLLKEMDPARWRETWRAAAAERLEALEARVTELLEATRTAKSEKVAELRVRLTEFRTVLAAHAVAARGDGEAWKGLHRRLQHAYESLADGLRTYEVHVPALRPTNYARNAFHVVWGCVALSLILFVLDADALLWAASGFVVYAWTMEGGRRLWPAMNDHLMKLYGRVAHPHEWNRVNSATWYATALIVLASTKSLLLCLVPVAVLTFADPAAALIGRRFGRTKLVNGRSLEGSSTFFVVGTIAAMLVAWLGAGLTPGLALAVGAGAALVGAVAELYSRRIDDNLSVPLASLAGAWAVAALLGVTI